VAAILISYSLLSWCGVLVGLWCGVLDAILFWLFCYVHMI